MTAPPVSEDQLLLIAEGESLIAYRNVKSDDLASELFLDSLRSNSDLGRPRRGSEVTHPLIHTGISVWEHADQAIRNAEKFPALGDFVAELRLDSTSDARYFAWGARPGHLTIWADPQKLREATVGTIPVGQRS